MAKNLGQMWYLRTPVLCHGSHDSGVFDRIKMTNVEEENKLADWESKNAEKIRKMVQVLRCLKEKMVEVQVERVAVFCNKGEHCLRIRSYASLVSHMCGAGVKCCTVILSLSSRRVSHSFVSYQRNPSPLSPL
jgi:hypothetical protein